jgi:hypothetical protein
MRSDPGETQRQGPAVGPSVRALAGVSEICKQPARAKALRTLPLQGPRGFSHSAQIAPALSAASFRLVALGSQRTA